ncbi:hypothetical protein TNCV_4890661 [Trichonephila clavipes]|nr:hypothetical protein TNCV_4890661 [Trichonephila clavipes]
MRKTSDLGAFDRELTECPRCMSHSISEIIQELGFSVFSVESTWRVGKAQLSSNDCGIGRLSRIVCSQRR